MGYYSDVALALTKAGYEKMMEKANKLRTPKREAVQDLFDKFTERKEQNGYVVLQWKYIKWYPQFFEISFIEDFLQELDPENPEEQYDFVRIGEDYEDLEYHFGIYDEQVLDIERSIYICID